jgi:formamidopyrimidine-DNA glycosylase
MWLLLDNNQALIIHLGMSGQVLLPNIVDPPHRHLRIRLSIAEVDKEIHFVDQRTFGHVTLDEIENGVPKSVQKIAPDVFDPKYQPKVVIEKIRKSNAEIKKLLLDQGVMSGVGNIYADEALWRAKIHPERIGKDLTSAQVAKIIDKCKEVMGQAIAAGGTSFDDLYVNVNGESGYFDRSLAAYGQNGAPCPRPKCRGLISKARFMGRYSHFCSKCQPKSG